MQYDEFSKLLRKRRSVRRFKPDPIPDGDIEKVLEAARWAMSGANAQPWEFIVVKDPETRKKIVDSWLEPRMEGYFIEQTRIPELRHQQFLKPPVSPSFKDAPVMIVVLGDMRTYQATVMVANYNGGKYAGGTYIKNMATTTQMIHLAAATLGLSSQWVSVGHTWEQLLKPILDIPIALDVHTIVPIGYPAYEPSPTYRRELKEIVHSEKYDMSKYRTGEDIIKFLRHLREQTRGPYKQEFDKR